jgi:hypothetical protein
LNNTLDTKTAAEAFNAILEKLGRDDLIDILLNWDDCEISEDGKNIIQYLGRDREYSHGNPVKDLEASMWTRHKV